MMTNWYCNPGWYALVISAGSLGVAFWALHVNRRVSRSTRESALVDRQAKINAAFVSYEVAGPYATHLRIPADRVKPFNAKSALLFHQLNLLHDVYLHRDILDCARVAAYESWMGTTLRPWIEQDDELRLLWKTIQQSKDMYGSEFIQWLDSGLKIVDRPA